MADDGQVLVNLGLIHRDNEVIPYIGTVGCLGCASKAGVTLGWYVWDQGRDRLAGRLAPSFEFVFHFNRQPQASPTRSCAASTRRPDSHLRADITDGDARQGWRSRWLDPACRAAHPGLPHP